MTGAGKDILKRYTARLIESLDRELQRLCPSVIETVFIGGGTPSLLDPGELGRFLEKAASLTGTAAEMSIEANPESLSPEAIAVLEQSAVNRISLGVQTYDNALLDWLGRPAGADAVRSADRNLRELWTGRLSRDLLAALPTTRRNLVSDLEQALADDPGHLSLYELTIEPGTPLAADRESLDRLPDAEESDREWQAALMMLESKGYERYEVSNFAGAGEECRHNLRYWQMKPYLGVGPSAASTLPGRDGRAIRREEKRDLPAWLDGAGADESVLDPQEFALEHFMMGLRIRQGLSVPAFTGIFGVRPDILAAKTIGKWGASGQLVTDGEFLCTGTGGMDLLDPILADIAGEIDSARLSADYHWPALTRESGA